MAGKSKAQREAKAATQAALAHWQKKEKEAEIARGAFLQAVKAELGPPGGAT